LLIAVTAEFILSRMKLSTKLELVRGEKNSSPEMSYLLVFLCVLKHEEARECGGILDFVAKYRLL